MPGRPARAATTRSDLVLPVFNRAGAPIAVTDIDSGRPSAFDATDARGLTAIPAETCARA